MMMKQDKSHCWWMSMLTPGYRLTYQKRMDNNLYSGSHYPGKMFRCHYYSRLHYSFHLTEFPQYLQMNSTHKPFGYFPQLQLTADQLILMYFLQDLDNRLPLP